MGTSLLISPNLMSKSFLPVSLALLGAASLTSFAHHGRDFLVVEDAHLPNPGAFQAMATFEWERTNGSDHFGIDPGLLLGVLPQLAIGVETSFRDESEGWEYTAVRPNIHLGLTPDAWKLPFKASLSAAYQFASGSPHRDTPEPAHDHHADHGHHHQDSEPEADTHHHANSIHNHSEDLFSVRLAIETNLTDSTRLVGNIIGSFPDSGSAAWGYAIGIRQSLNDITSLGVEALGDFEADGWQELSAAVYFDPADALTLKLGAGVGLNDQSPDFLLRLGATWRF